MEDDNVIFQSGNKLPPIIRGIIGEKHGEYMQPGEETWTVPWAVKVDADGIVSINQGLVARNETPGGTVALKVVKDFDGLYIDATALSKDELSRDFEPGEHEQENQSEVIGVLYPLISDSRGLEPGAVERFNRDQQEVHKKFADYFKSTFHREYKFAWEEYPGYRELGDLLRGADY